MVPEPEPWLIPKPAISTSKGQLEINKITVVEFHVVSDIRMSEGSSLEGQGQHGLFQQGHRDQDY